MRTNDVTAERLRELAERRPAHGKVLSLFLDLTPSEFATPPARKSQINSLLSKARDRVDEAELDHDERARLRDDLARLEEELAPDTLPADGAEGLAVFALGGDDIEVLRLPRPVPTQAILGDAPHVEPLADAARFEPNWCVVLVSRGAARFFFGPPESLTERSVADFSQDRFEREVGSEIDAHLRHVAEFVKLTLQRGMWRHLLIGGPHELLGQFEELLPNDARGRVAGHFDADVENVAADAVSAQATEAARRLAEGRQTELLARFEEGLARPDGRAVAGLQQTRDALEQRRVEALLLASGGERDEQAVEEAVRAAVQQDAEVLHIAEPEGTPFAPYWIGAVLRF